MTDEVDASTAAVVRKIADQIKEMTPAEFQAALQEAGIIDEGGGLTRHYRAAKRK